MIHAVQDSGEQYTRSGAKRAKEKQDTGSHRNSTEYWSKMSVTIVLDSVNLADKVSCWSCRTTRRLTSGRRTSTACHQLKSQVLIFILSTVGMGNEVIAVHGGKQVQIPYSYYSESGKFFCVDCKRRFISDVITFPPNLHQHCLFCQISLPNFLHHRSHPINQQKSKVGHDEPSSSIRTHTD